jgi:uncharacterized membrane protein YraQ (UPF0718 family)
MDTFTVFSAIATAIFIEAMPFLAIGALFSAMIEVFVSEERMLRFVPRNIAGGLLLGVGAGFILPTCECGVVLIVRRLIHKGVPPYIAIAYMLAAPIVNPVVLASTWLAFRGSIPMLASRVVLAVVVAVAIGLYSRTIPDVLRSAKGANAGDHAASHDHVSQSFAEKINAVLTHAAQEFMDMGKYLIIGALAAATFKTLLPMDIMSLIGGNLLLAIIGMMALAIILSVCSEADAFVAASFQMMPAAAHLAFVAIGPMVDLKLIGMYSVTFNRKLVLALVLGPTVMILVLSWLIGATGLLAR